MSHVLQGSEEIALALELDDTVAVVLYLHYLSGEPASAEAELSSDLCLFTGAADDLPQLIALLFQQEELDKAACAELFAVKSRRDDTGVVHHLQVTFSEMIA